MKQTKHSLQYLSHIAFRFFCLALIVTAMSVLYSCSKDEEKTNEQQKDTTPAASDNDPDAPLSFTVEGQTFTLIKVKAGTFMMGATSEQDNEGPLPDEKPIHEVTISSDYYIGETEVTQGLYKAVMGNNPSEYDFGDNYPAEQTAFTDAIEFCEKLSQLTGRTFTLPTEAQWEYAGRGGHNQPAQQTVYAGGNNILSVAWVLANSKSDSLHTWVTHPVKTKLPNSLKLYDMTGSISEWCLDYYDEFYYASSPAVDPAGPATATLINSEHKTGHSIRGGNWSNDPIYCRISARTWAFEDYARPILGFRVVMIP